MNNQLVKIVPNSNELQPKMYPNGLVYSIANTVEIPILHRRYMDEVKLLQCIFAVLLTIVGLLTYDIIRLEEIFISTQLERIRQTKHVSTFRPERNQDQGSQLTPSSENKTHVPKTTEPQVLPTNDIHYKLNITKQKKIDSILQPIELVQSSSKGFADKEKAYQMLIKQSPGTVSHVLGLAVLLGKNKKWRDASVAYEKACRMLKNDPNCEYNLAVSLDQQGLKERALSHYIFAKEFEKTTARNFSSSVLENRIETLSGKYHARTAANTVRINK